MSKILLFSKSKKVLSKNVFSFFGNGIIIDKNLQNALNKKIFKNFLESWFFLFFCEKLVYIKNKSFSFKMSIFVKKMVSLMKMFVEVYYFEFKLYGLGYRIIGYKNIMNRRVVTLSLGISHDIHYIFPENVFILLGRKRFIIYSNNIESLKMVYNHLIFLKKKNSYKLKGMFDVKKILSFKKGKQKQH
jgi:ribosomal protein L6P/L9E